MAKKPDSKVTKTIKDCVKTEVPSSLKKGKTAEAKTTLSGCLTGVSNLSSESLNKLQSGTIGAKVTYTSSNKKVASVNSEGTIKGKKKGTTVIKITVQLSNGKKYTSTKKVTIK